MVINSDSLSGTSGTSRTADPSFGDSTGESHRIIAEANQEIAALKAEIEQMKTSTTTTSGSTKSASVVPQADEKPEANM